MNNPDPQLREFILFCFRRCGKEWPAIYDEMAIVAGQKLFNGLGHDELKQLGLSLRVSNLDRTVELVKQVIYQNQYRMLTKNKVSITLVADHDEGAFYGCESHKVLP